MIVGIALIYYRFSTWKGKTIHIEDLIVTKNFRNKGIGNLLFERVINYANEMKVKEFPGKYWIGIKMQLIFTKKGS